MRDSSENILSRSKENKWDFLDLIGKSGPWQRRVFLTALFISIPAATHNLAMSFLAPNIDHWCARPQQAHNITVHHWRSTALPQDDQKCSRYEDMGFNFSFERNINENNKIVPCDIWEYDTAFYTSTVVSKWDLVCNREWLVSLSKSVFMAGVLFADVVLGYFADRFGRRPLIVIGAFTTVSFATVCSFSTSFSMFIVARFFVAVGISTCYTITFVLLMEVVDSDLRSAYGLAMNFGWCIGFMVLPGIAWLLRDWFWIQVTLTVPCFLMLGLWWVIPESPRWLLSQGRVEEACKVLTQAAATNGVNHSDIDTTLKELIAKDAKVHESGRTNAHILDLLRTSSLRKIALNIYFTWFVCAFVYYGLSYNTNELAGDPFINFAISGAVEFPAYFLSIFAIRSMGRKKPLIFTMVIGGTACLLAYILPPDPGWLPLTVATVGKFCITSSFGIIFVYTTELFPTVLRNVGFGFASLCGRVGSALAPFVRELENATHPAVPQVVFGILAIISGSLVWLLPETNNRDIPDTVKEAAQAESWRTGKKRKSQKDVQCVAVTFSKLENDNDLLDGPHYFPPVILKMKNGYTDNNAKESETDVSSNNFAQQMRLLN